MANTKISALPVVSGTINTSDKFPFNSASTTSACTFQTIINNLATSYQPLNANLTTLAGVAPTTLGLNLVGAVAPSTSSYMRISNTGIVSNRIFSQVLADIGAQGSSLALATLSAVGPATTTGLNVLLATNPTTAGYMNVGASGAYAQVDNYNTTALNIRPYLIPPVVNRQSSVTTDWNVDFASADFWILAALGGNINVKNPTGSPINGSKLMIRLKDSGSRRNLVFDTMYRATSGAALPTVTENGTLYLDFIYNDQDTKWDLLVRTYA